MKIEIRYKTNATFSTIRLLTKIQDSFQKQPGHSFLSVVLCGS